MSDLLQRAYKEIQELQDKCAELQLANESLRQKNYALMDMLPFTDKYRVFQHELAQPVKLRGQDITYVAYNVPDYN